MESTSGNEVHATRADRRYIAKTWVREACTSGHLQSICAKYILHSIMLSCLFQKPGCTEMGQRYGKAGNGTAILHLSFLLLLRSKLLKFTLFGSFQVLFEYISVTAAVGKVNKQINK